MKLRTLALASLMLTGAAVFAANTAQVIVSATVSSEAVITPVQPVSFSNVLPSTLQNTDITSTSQVVSIYDNNNTLGTQISTTCSKTDGNSKGCYICTGASCDVDTQVLLSCTYTPCGANPTDLVITPSATDSSASFNKEIPAANASPAACSATPGAFKCTMNKTGLINPTGNYTGALAITVSDA